MGLYAVVVAVDDANIPRPVEPPQECQIDTDGVIESHRLPFNSWRSVEIPSRLAHFPARHIFAGGLCELFQPTLKEEEVAWGGGYGLESQRATGFFFAIFDSQFC